jgi:S1-C subfamily serine protease
MVAFPALTLLVALSAAPDIVLIEFSHPTCGPCQAMQPTIERLVSEGYPIQAVNVEQQSDLARQYQITAVPTCVLLVNGQEATRVEGVRTRDELRQLFAGAAEAANAAAQEEVVVRGQSPQAGRGLGLFSKLGGFGRRASDPGDPPLQMSGASAPAADPPEFGRDNAFAARPRQDLGNQDLGHNAPVENVAPLQAVPQQAPHQFQPQSRQQPLSADVAAMPPAASGDSASERALAATVRLKVEDPNGFSFGTGTIIDSLKDEALVVTCGHIFRDSQRKGKILVDLHVAGASEPVVGQLISFDLTRDIALVSIRPGMGVTPAPVAGDPRLITPGARVFSVGCDHGREPTVHDSRLVAVNKYAGSPNYTAAGMPVEGRSGGGLFLADGSLIGICNAADEQDNEGLYAALPTVHWQLDQIGQTAIYQRGAGAEAALLAQAMPQAVPQGDLPLPEISQAAPIQPAAAQSDTELMFMVRSKSNPAARGEMVIINQPTPQLMELLARESSSGQPGAAQMQPTAMRTAPQPEPNPTIRAQSPDNPSFFMSGGR